MSTFINALSGPIFTSSNVSVTAWVARMFEVARQRRALPRSCGPGQSLARCS